MPHHRKGFYGAEADKPQDGSSALCYVPKFGSFVPHPVESHALVNRGWWRRRRQTMFAHGRLRRHRSVCPAPGDAGGREGHLNHQNIWPTTGEARRDITWSADTHMHTCTHIYMHTRAHTQTHVHMHTHAQMHTHIHTRIYTCTHIHAHTRTHTNTHAYTCTHVHRCTHVHMRTHTHVSRVMQT